MPGVLVFSSFAAIGPPAATLAAIADATRRWRRPGVARSSGRQPDVELRASEQQPCTVTAGLQTPLVDQGVDPLRLAVQMLRGLGDADPGFGLASLPPRVKDLGNLVCDQLQRLAGE